MKRILRLMVPFLSGILLSFALLFSGCATVSPSQVQQTEAAEETTRAFTFFNQTFQVPVSWPSETAMKELAPNIYTQGQSIAHYFTQELDGGFTIYWVIGAQYNSKFTTKYLTQTWGVYGSDFVRCTHWVINPDQTITEISCEDFNIGMKQVTLGTI